MSVEFEELNKLRENTEDNVPESKQILFIFEISKYCVVYKSEYKKI